MSAAEDKIRGQSATKWSAIPFYSTDMATHRSRFEIDLPRDVLRRARRRDPAALEIIYLRFRKPVYGVALRIHRDPGIAQDIVQDTFVAMIRNVPRYRDSAPFWRWLRRIAVNRAIDVLRHRERADGEAIEIEALAAPLQAIDRHLDIDSALGRLPNSARAIVWLHEVEGLTHQEIAALLGKSESYSKSVLARSLGRLAERYREEPTGSPVSCT